jgi:hypothetical protein
VFFSFEQALEAAGALQSRGIISENERKWLLSQAVFLPIFTKSHPLAGVWPRREEVLNEVFHDSQREAARDWPHA